MIRFVVPAVPVALPRGTPFRLGDGSMRVAVPQTHAVTAFKATVRLAAAQATKGPPLEGPLSVTIDFIMPRPKVKCWKAKPTPRYPYTGRSDIDNIGKAVLDALNALVWRDDRQIAILNLSAFVAAGDEQPHVVVQVGELEA